LHILLAALGILAAAVFLAYRTRRPDQKTREVPGTVMNGHAPAGRFGFRTGENQHPTEAVDDPRVTGAALLVMVAATDGGISKAEEDEILAQLQSVFGLPASEATDLYRFARWLAEQGSNPDDMIQRLITRTITLGGRDTLPDMIRMVRAVGIADTGTLTDDTYQVIERLKQMSAGA
jgi:uncharacterized tellurite resistance protein B-like protein